MYGSPAHRADVTFVLFNPNRANNQLVQQKKKKGEMFLLLQIYKTAREIQMAF